MTGVMLEAELTGCMDGWDKGVMPQGMTFLISEKPTAYMGLQGMSCSCVYISWSVHSNLLEPKAAVSGAWKRARFFPVPMRVTQAVHFSMGSFL